MTSHNRKWKERKREEIKKLVDEYPFVAVVTLQDLPANVASSLRKKLKGQAEIVVAKTRVIQKAFEEASTDTSKLDPLVEENIAVIFSKKNPFELYSFIKKNKGNASAKPGDIAEDEIIVKAGDTGLPPGPALSGLKAVGLKVQVQGPTISISEDKLVAKKGDEITEPIADVLGKLDMKPMKVGMQVLGVLDKNDDQFYKADVLDVDEEELFDKFVSAYKHALNLSVEAGYFNEDSTEVIIVKAEREAKAVDKAVQEASPETKEEKKEETEKPVEESKEEIVEKEKADNNSAEETTKKEKPAEEGQKEEKKEGTKEEPKEEGSAETKEKPKDDNSQSVDKQEVEDVAEQVTDSSKKTEEKNSENEKDSDNKKVEDKKE